MLTLGCLSLAAAGFGADDATIQTGEKIFCPGRHTDAKFSFEELHQLIAAQRDHRTDAKGAGAGMAQPSSPTRIKDSIRVAIANPWRVTLEPRNRKANDVLER